MKTLWAFYDFAVSPANFDFFCFLTKANLVRRETGLDKLHVVFVPGPHHGFRGKDKPYSTDQMQWRLHSLLVPGCALVNATFTVCEDREHARLHSLIKLLNPDYVFPLNYTVDKPLHDYQAHGLIAAAKEGIEIPRLQATPQARLYASKYLERCRKPVITITTRECYREDRNSNMVAWEGFAGAQSDYDVIWVRDTEKSFNGHGCAQAALNIDFRLALYELSFLNLGINNGPMTLCTFSNAPCLVFKMITKTTQETTAAWLNQLGLETGGQWSYALDTQRIVWEDDDYKNLIVGFDSMVREKETELLTAYGMFQGYAVG